jgi:carbon monoxide dehydrogenase subunit G
VIRVERAIDVERPATEVFDRLTNIEDLPRWQPGITEARLESPPPLRAGSRIRLVANVGGQRVVAAGTVTELERPSRIGLVARAGSSDVEGAVSITPSGAEACRLSVATSIRLGGMLRFAEGIARSRIEAEAPGVVAGVKAWLEAEEPDPAGTTGAARPGSAGGGGTVADGNDDQTPTG